MSSNSRTFYTLILTQTFSLIGSRISSLAMSIWIFNQTGNATPLALVSFFTILPTVVASSISGVLADRWDRRYVMVIADAGQAVGTLLLLISFASGSFELWHLYLVAFVNAVFGVFQGPAFQASITMLIPDSQRDRANAIQQLTGPMAGIIAPAIAGVIYAAVGVIGAIAIDLLTFVIAMFVVFTVHIPRPSVTAEGLAMRGTILSESLSGLRYLLARRPLFMLMMYISLLNFVASGIMTLATPYILARTGSEASLGLVLSVTNVGAIVGGIIIGAWGGTRPRMHTIMPAIILSSVFMTLVGVSQTTLALAAISFMFMLPLPMVNALFMSIMQAKVAPDVQGRVFATLGQISTLLMPIALLLVGPLADNVFEPAVGQAGWEAVAPFVGSTFGSGMGLIYVLGGTAMALISIVVFAIPSLRNMEAALPDYVAEPQAENVPDNVPTPEPAVA
jgi:MFS family permease